jgi:hypothetical protein
MRVYVYFLFIIFLYLVVGVFYSNINLEIVEKNKAISLESNKDFYDYSGVINVHSKKSSGSSSIQDIIQSANEVGLDFIIFNEEMPLGRKEPPAINYGGLSVFYGFELPYKNTSILFTDRLNSRTFTSNSEIQIFLSDYFENGGDELVVLAHPSRPGFQWNDEVPQEISGIEVLNLREVWRSAWRDRKFLFLRTLLFYPFNPSLFFLNIYSDRASSIEQWDAWNSKAHVNGYVGSDVNSKLRLGRKYINFPGYKTVFSMAKNHVVLKEELTSAQKDKLILEALNKGNSYFSLDIFGNPAGFAFYAKNKDSSLELMGSEVELEKVETLKVNLPSTKIKVKTVLFKDSRIIKKKFGSLDYQPVEPGVYRVELHVAPRFPIFREQKWIPWVFSNPIKINP